MAAPNPDHLLDHADRLAATGGAGAPRQTDLRRAISAAYYALFHAVASAVADDLAGRTHRHTARYALVYRTINHGSLRRLCEQVRAGTVPPKHTAYVPKGGFGADLIAFSSALIDLQEKRHLADYDPLFRARASDAVLAVATARSALTRFNRAGRVTRKAFTSLVVFSPR